MKPIELTVSAFGPYPEQIVIPMGQLGTHGLFLVTGDTGAGKTSIFDAICFALFGEVSGSQRASDQLRSDFARPETETFVRLRFTHCGAAYDIVRTPKYNRPKKRGVGMVTQAANAVLTLPDGTTVAGAAAVTEEVERILGVGCASFKQISMIAQGEFLKLLTADSRTRAEIIRRVFHTEPLAALQKKLKERYLDSNRRCEAGRQAAAQYAEGFRLPEDMNCDVSDLPALLDAVRALQERDAAAAQRSENERKTLRQAQQEAVEAVVHAQQDNACIDKYQAACAQQEELEQQRGPLERMRTQALQSRRAREIVLPAWQLWEQAQAQRTQLAGQKEALAQQLTQLHAQTGQHQQTLAQAEAKKPALEQLAQRITRLTDAQQAVEKWQQACAQADALERQMQTRQQAAQQQLDAQHAIEQRIAVLREQLAAQDAVQLDMLRLRSERTQSEQIEKQMLRVLERFAQLHALSEERDTGQRAYLRAEQAFQQAQRRYMDSELAWNREQAGILAQSLCDGQPCPVCGSLTHPAPAVLSAGAPSERTLQQQKKQLEQARAAYQEQREQCTMRTTRQQQAQQDIADALRVLEQPEDMTEQAFLAVYQAQQARTGELERKSRQLEQQAQALGQQEKQLAQQEEQLTAQKQRAEQAERAYREAETQAVSARAAAQQLRASIPYEQLDALDAQLAQSTEQKAALEREIQTAQQQWDAHQHACQRAQELYQTICGQLTHSEQAENTAQEQWRCALTQAGFADGEQYQHALRTQAQQQELERQVSAYDQQCAAVRSRLNEYAAAKTMVRRDLAALTQAREQAQQACRECEEKLHVYTERMKTNARVMQRVEQTMRDTAALEQRTAALRELSQTANGELSGKQKLMLEQYVQAAYFDRMLARANVRLRDMTQGRYAMRRRQKAENNRSQTGLDIDVIDYYTGKTRSVRTLSGGESFLGALSLALGMSDVIQSYAGGVRVETVFIDEGFGSLDSAALEQAISVLIRLSDGDRLIGIISHVSELKDRIGRQIVVRRASSGSTADLITE